MAPLVGFMIDHAGWEPTLVSSSVFAFVAAGLWIFVCLPGTQGAHA
jgi:hypothetical protein